MNYGSQPQNNSDLRGKQQDKNVNHFAVRLLYFLLFKPPISSDIPVFSALHAQTQCLPCPPLFHGRTSWAERFFAGFGNWYSYKP